LIGSAALAKRQFPLFKVYGLLEPGPVVLLTTAHQGKANVMTMSWHTMMEFEPPRVGCVVSNRHVSFDALEPTRQVAVEDEVTGAASAWTMRRSA